MTEAEVATTVRKLVPALTDPLATPADQIEALRDWLHSFLPTADQTNNLEDLGYNHHQDSLATLLHLAENRAGGYYCGPITEISRRVYLALGFEAVSMNYQVTQGGTTHVTTLVRMPQNGAPIWTVQDCYFNFTVRRADGRYLGYRELLARLAAGDTSDVRLDESPDDRTPALHGHHNRDKIHRISEKYAWDLRHVRDYPEFGEYSIQWDLQVLLLLFPLREELETTLGTNNPLYLLAFPLSTSGQDTVLDLAAYAREQQAVMLERYTANPQAYASTRIDAQLAPHLERIRAWPAEDDF